MEQRAAVAMETIGAELLAAGIIFGGEEFKAALLLGGKGCFAAQGAVEFGIEGGDREEIVFEGESDFFGGDFGRAEGSGEKL